MSPKPLVKAQFNIDIAHLAILGISVFDEQFHSFPPLDFDFWNPKRYNFVYTIATSV